MLPTTPNPFQGPQDIWEGPRGVGGWVWVCVCVHAHTHTHTHVHQGMWPSHLSLVLLPGLGYHLLVLLLHPVHLPLVLPLHLLALLSQEAAELPGRRQGCDMQD